MIDFFLSSHLSYFSNIVIISVHAKNLLNIKSLVMTIFLNYNVITIKTGIVIMPPTSIFCNNL